MRVGVFEGSVRGITEGRVGFASASAGTVAIDRDRFKMPPKRGYYRHLSDRTAFYRSQYAIS